MALRSNKEPASRNLVVRKMNNMDQVMREAFRHVGNSPHWEILPRVSLNLPGFLSAHGVAVIIAVLLTLLIAVVLPRISKKCKVLLELFVLFVRDGIALPNIGEEDGRRMTPLLCSLFSFILVMNLTGLIPGFPAATANLGVTAALASVTLLVMTVGTVFRIGAKKFLMSFVPSGVPWPILFILVPIEFGGLFIRSFALAIRLFANVFAGHLVLFSVVGVIVIFGARAAPLELMAVLIYMIEVLVAFLQAYIFTLLSAIFIGQTLHPAH